MSEYEENIADDRYRPNGLNYAPTINYKHEIDLCSKCKEVKIENFSKMSTRFNRKNFDIQVKWRDSNFGGMKNYD